MTTRRPGRRQPTKQDEKFAAARSRKAWLAVLSDEQGRRVLWDVLERTGYHDPINLRGEEATFALGRRIIGCWMREYINSINPVALRTMEAECDPVEPPEVEADDEGEEGSE